MRLSSCKGVPARQLLLATAGGLDGWRIQVVIVMGTGLWQAIGRYQAVVVLAFFPPSITGASPMAGAYPQAQPGVGYIAGFPGYAQPFGQTPQTVQRPMATMGRFQPY